MAFIIADLVRLPIVVIFDALVASKIQWIWQFGRLTGYSLTLIGLSLSVYLFTWKAKIITDVYRFLLAAIIHIGIICWNFSVMLISHHKYYSEKNETHSLLFSITDHIFQSTELYPSEIDFAVKSFTSIVVLIVLQALLIMTLGEKVDDTAAHMLVTALPSFALAFNIPVTFLTCLILISNVPMLYLFGKKMKYLRVQHQMFRQQERNRPWTFNIDNMLNWVNDKWVTCRVPSVLRLFFIFKCVWGAIVLTSNENLFTNESYGSNVRNGIYYFFNPAPKLERTHYDYLGEHHPPDENKINLTYFEGMAVLLTDSLISSFSVGSAISVVGHYVGLGLHEFVGGNGIMQGEALGMMSSVLFCLLSIQTGLSSLPPLKRLARLYRNSFLLGSAVLHFFLDVVHPVLMTISPQSHIPMKKHLKPLLVCLLLLVVPSMLCYWIIMNKTVSTWMVALIAFNVELIVKVLSTLLVYLLYFLDGRSQGNGIVNLDEYVFWIRSVSHCIEFFCGLVMFFNGAYILFFESSNLLRAIMMSMHAYVNIYRTFKEGVKTFNNRRTVNKKINSMQLIISEEIDPADMDVCSICYQEFVAENGEIRMTRCKHMFHSSCIRKWIFIQDSCPMCDRTLFTVEEDNEKKD